MSGGRPEEIVMRHRWDRAWPFTVAALAVGLGLGAGSCLLPSYPNAGDTDTGGGGATSSAGGATSSAGGGYCGFCPEWTLPLTGEGDEKALAVAVSAVPGAEDVVVGGSMTSALRVGETSTVIMHKGLTDGYVARLTAAGVPFFAGVFHSTVDAATDQVITAVGFDSEGALIVAGQYRTELTALLAPMSLSGAGGIDVFVAKYNADGTFAWQTVFTGPGDDRVHALAVDSANDVLLAGEFQQTVSFGGTPASVASGTGPDAFVVKVAGKLGDTLWATPFGGIGDDVALDLAIHTDNSVTAVGYFQATVTFDGMTLDNMGGDDGFLLHLTPGGTYAGLKGIGNDGAEAVLAVIPAPGPPGSVLVAGTFTSSLALLDTFESTGPADLFLAEIAPNGLYTSNDVFVDASPMIDTKVVLARAPDGGFALAGNHSSPVDFGTGAIAAEDVDGYVVRLGPGYERLWYAHYGGPIRQLVQAVAFDPKGAMLVAGDFDGPTDLGTGPVAPQVAGQPDGFVQKLLP
jgi:hypothetical protein